MRQMHDCCYMHGFLHGLDISPYGRNALIAALPIEDADAYKAPPYATASHAGGGVSEKIFIGFHQSLGALAKSWRRQAISTWQPMI